MQPCHFNAASTTAASSARNVSWKQCGTGQASSRSMPLAKCAHHVMFYLCMVYVSEFYNEGIGEFDHHHRGITCIQPCNWICVYCLYMLRQLASQHKTDVINNCRAAMDISDAPAGFVLQSNANEEAQAVLQNTPRHRVVFQFDYKGEQIGAYLFLLTLFDSRTAAEVVMSFTERIHDEDTRSAVLEFCKSDPNSIREMIREYLQTAPPNASEWCEDIDAAAYHAVVQKDVQWFRPTCEVWGVTTAREALTVFRKISSDMIVDAVMRRRAFPPAFRHVDDGEALLIWQPDLLKPSRILPRPHDLSYGALTFRISVLCEQETLQPYDIFLSDEEIPGLIIRCLLYTSDAADE